MHAEFPCEPLEAIDQRLVPDASDSPRSRRTPPPRFGLVAAAFLVLRGETKAADPVDDSALVDFQGEWSGLQLFESEEETEAEGYVLDLWKDGRTLIGNILFYCGPPADPAQGLLENVHYEPRTHRFEFESTFGFGVQAVADSGTSIPKGDRYRFEGTLTPALIKGRLIHTWGTNIARRDTTSVSWTRQRNRDLPDHELRSEWMRRQKPRQATTSESGNP